MFRYIHGGYTDNALSATKATNIAAGSANSLPYQSAADTTAMLAVNATVTIKSLKSVSSGAPAWTQDTVAECSDYESGTWTPTDLSGAALTLTINQARYIKIGKTCTVFISITYPTTASSSAAVLSLPFSAITNCNAYNGAIVSGLGANLLSAVNSSASAGLYFIYNGTTSIANSSISAKTVSASITYQLA